MGIIENFIKAGKNKNCYWATLILTRGARKLSSRDIKSQMGRKWVLCKASFKGRWKQLQFQRFHHQKLWEEENFWKEEVGTGVCMKTKDKMSRVANRFSLPGIFTGFNFF